ncbi:MAG: flagellar filament outer layer protein FlaA [Treponema sp.]|jgi:hypothetical protein|nr:flagellar filament outer layer protein FlaA [Treponema sp.]
MKRIFVFAVATLVAVGSAFADEKSLIDFRELAADVTPDGQKILITQDGQKADGNTQNNATLMDFRSQAGAFASPEQRNAMISSLAIANWDVVFTSSARTLENRRLSYTREAPNAARDKDTGELTGETETVMGVRIHFPVEAYNSSARIVPPFPIPGFDKESTEEGQEATPYASASRFKPFENGDGTADRGKGIIYNVGTIKSVQVEVYGLNFPHKLSIILIDNLGNEKIIPMGTLNYEGWGRLTWTNPQYVTDVRNREQRLYPIYPQSQTFIRFGGFIVQKDASAPGGDFISYFKEVRVIYDQAVYETSEPRDIIDEDVWKIIDTRETFQNRTDLLQFGNDAVQQYLDTARQAQGGERGLSTYSNAYPTANALGAGSGAPADEEQ